MGKPRRRELPGRARRAAADRDDGHVAPATTSTAVTWKRPACGRSSACYADFIGMPVYLNDEADPANAVTAPGTAITDQSGSGIGPITSSGKISSYMRPPCKSSPSTRSSTGTTYPSPTGKGHGRVRAVLAITDRHMPDVNARGIVDVYIKRMFIAAGNRDVLPTWANSCRASLECDELTPNAARDNVVRNAALAAVQQNLGWLIVDQLTELSQRDHQRLRRHHAMALLPHARDVGARGARGFLPRGRRPDAAGKRPGRRSPSPSTCALPRPAATAPGSSTTSPSAAPPTSTSCWPVPAASGCLTAPSHSPKGSSSATRRPGRRGCTCTGSTSPAQIRSSSP